MIEQMEPRLPELNLPKHDLLNLAVYLQSPETQKVKLTNGQILSRRQIVHRIKQIIVLLNPHFPPQEQLKSDEAKHLLDSLNQSFVPQATIKRLLHFFQVYLRLSTAGSNRPSTDQLAEWMEEMASLQAQQAEKEEAIQVPDYTSLKTQIEIIQKIKTQTEKTLKDHWQYLSPEEQEEIKEELAQSLAGAALQAQRLKKSPHLPKPKFVQQAVENSRKNSLAIQIGVPREKQVELALAISQAISPEEEKKLIKAKKETGWVIAGSVSSQEVVRRITQKTPLSAKEAQKLVRRLESFYPGKPPTRAETERAVSLGLDRSMVRGLKKNGYSLEETVAQLTPTIGLYYQGLPVIRQRESWLKPASKKTRRWARRWGISPLTADKLLAGLSLEQIEQQINGWQTRGLSLAGEEKLKRVVREIRKIETGLKNKQLGFFLRLKIKKARRDREKRILLAALNPLFVSNFYRYNLVKPQQLLETKILALNQYLSFLEKEGPAHPLDIRFQANRLRWGFYQKRLQGWQRRIEGTKNPRLKKFLSGLPNKLRPSYWTSLPYRALRSGLSKGMIKIGSSLAKKAGGKLLKTTGRLLVKGGQTMFKEGFKQLFKKGVAYAAGSILSGGVGLAVAGADIVWGLAKGGYKLITSREARKRVGRLLSPVVKMAGATLFFAISLIKLFPATFLGGALGALAGPTGSLAGAGIGFFIDRTITPLLRGGQSPLQKIWFPSGAGAAQVSEIGAGQIAGATRPPGLASPAALAPGAGAGSLLSQLLAPAATPIIAVGGIGILTAFTLVVDMGSYITAGPAPPAADIENPPPGESESLTIEKTTAKSQFSNGEAANNPQVVYTITITPKEGAEITIKEVKEETLVYSGAYNAPQPEISLSPDSENPEGKKISQPLSFNYLLTLGSQFQDSRIKNTATATIETSEKKTETVSASSTISIGVAPGISCPIPPEENPYASCLSYQNPASGCHHGANAYWGGNSCRSYRIPVFDDCWGPTTENKMDPGGGLNKCYNPSNTCKDYGKALDVAPKTGAGADVVLPSINNNSSVIWNYERESYSNWGWGQLFNTTHGKHNYHLVIYHVNEAAPITGCQQCPAGTVIGTVYGKMSRPHIHIELSIDGSYVMPEEFMCQELTQPIAQPSPSPPSTSLEPVVFGNSANGNKLSYYKIGQGSRAYAVIGGIHGGYEGNTVLLVNKMVEHLEKNPEIVPDDISLYLVANANPDGYQKCCCACFEGWFNGQNVDLNRNWDYNWKSPACYDSACSREVDAGSQPFSEPETRALKNLISSKNIQAAIFYHSAMGVVFYGAENNTSQDLAQTVSQATGYPVREPMAYVTGDAVDWMSKQGLAGIEIELTDHYGAEWGRNLEGLEALLNWRP